MVDPNDPKRREVETMIETYVCFWGFVCLASAILFAGWPALMTWAAIFYGMRVFREVMFGSGTPSKPKSPQSTPRKKCRK